MPVTRGRSQSDVTPHEKCLNLAFEGTSAAFLVQYGRVGQGADMQPAYGRSEDFRLKIVSSPALVDQPGQKAVNLYGIHSHSGGLYGHFALDIERWSDRN